MAESEAVHLDISIDSDESAANTDMDANMGLRQDSGMQDIFKAAKHFSHQDRIDAAAERQKNQKLLDFISAHGFSIQEVNEFVSKGVVTRKVNARDMFVKSPMRDDNANSKLKDVVNSGSSPAGKCQVDPSVPTVDEEAPKARCLPHCFLMQA